MELPKVLEDIILDYAWSHHTFLRMSVLLQQLKKKKLMAEMRIFYGVFNAITLQLQQDHIHPTE